MIEVSTGEIVDKFTILSIKLSKITDESKLNNVLKEYNYLDGIIRELNIDDADLEPIHEVNQVLWDIEDSIRERESMKLFDDVFINLARNVYINNDLRAEIKKQINIKYQSAFVEEKSYKPY
jgi:hypothetical protein